MNNRRSQYRSSVPRRRATFRPRLEVLEGRLMLTAPIAPVIIEPETNGQVVSNFDVHMEIDPAAFFDADGDAHQATTWRIRETAANGGATVWQALGVTDPLTKNHIHFGDGAFVGTLAGKSALLASRNYVLNATFTDSNGEVSVTSTRAFQTAAVSTPVPGAGTWIVREGYQLELAAPAQAFRLPVNIAFAPNPGQSPDDPLYYVAELYGSIKVVTRSGQVSDYASGLLDYNPSGPISGSGEQGLTGLAVDPATGDLFVGMLWNNGTSNAQRGGATLHFPKVERLHSNDGGRTLATRTILLNMQPETQGQSHQISNVSLGPDGKLYVHMGDGMTSSTALNLDLYRGKVLRMNTDGTAPSDNPFFSAANGINARDYVFTYGHRNPFGGAWRAANNEQYVVENGNSLDRLVNLTSGKSYGWAGSDSALTANSLYTWDPSTAPVNIAFVQPQTFGGSLFLASSQDDAFVGLSGPTYASGPQTRGKRIEQFSNLDALNSSGKLTTAPITLVRYNGTNQASIGALAAGPDGLYFSDLYRDDGVGGATAVGANIYRLRYVDFHPNGVTAVAGDGQVALSWTPDPLAVTHNVYRSIEGGVPVVVGAGVTGTAFTDLTATNGTHYHYIVRGVNAGGESSDSNEAHATPTAPPSQPPAVAVAASAAPAAVNGTTTDLSVLGADDGGESNLRYTWGLQGTPPAAVTFSANGTNAAKYTTATFTKAGTYNFAVAIRDMDGQSVLSTVTVTVNQTLSEVALSPTSANVVIGGTRQFTATARDQFGVSLAAQPAFDWSIDGGGVGAVSQTGLYQAPVAGAGAATVRATAGSFSAVTTVTVTTIVPDSGTGLAAVYYNNADFTGSSLARTDPTVNFNFASGSPAASIGADTFSARWLGQIEPRYSQTYTFTTTSDDGVRLWVNNQLIIDQWNNHPARQHSGTIALVAGQRPAIRLEYYENTGFAVIKLEWQSASQAREVVPQSRLYITPPEQTIASIAVAPAIVNVPLGGTAQFTAAAKDQFGNAVVPQPTFAWSIDTGGVGGVSSIGLYQSPAAGIGAATVRATAGAFSGVATVTVGAVAAGTGNGLSAVYFNNSNLTGTSSVRTDPTVNFNFAKGSPTAFIGAETFSARWLGQIEPRYSQTYTFTTTSDDGVRLWVNDKLVINQWNNHSARQDSGTVALVAGQRSAIRLEYYENTGSAVIKLEWQSASQAREVVPQSRLYSGPPIQVNFQPAAAAVPAGYLIDAGAAFGAAAGGYSYGWNGNNAASVFDRNSSLSADQRYDTVALLQSPNLPTAVWEIALPSGPYRVHLVSGDANSFTGVYKTTVEGILIVDGTPTTGQRWLEGWRDVFVADGRLTVSSAAGAQNNTLSFIDIFPLSAL